MIPSSGPTREHGLSGSLSSPHPKIRIVLRQAQSTAPERFLLMATTALVPMQSNLPLFLGFSSTFVLFGILLVYQVLCRPGIFLRTVQHPVSRASYLFIGLILMIEIAHGSPAFYEIVRIGFMLLGAVVLASLCRDRRALFSGIYGYILGSMVLSALLLFTTYGKLSSAAITDDFYNVSVLRKNAFSDNPLQDNLNTMALFAAQGAILAMALGLTAKTLRRQSVFLGLGMLCIAGTFITMSRSGIVILVLAYAAILYVYGIMRPKVFIAGTIIAVVIAVWVPNVVFSRLGYSTETSGVIGGYKDSRVPIYKEVIERFPEYILTGVGMGHFYGDWGRRTEFNMGGGLISGVHNCPAQVAINWGLLGLIAFLRLIWQAYKCIPRRGSTDPLRLCILGLAVAAVVWLMVIHNLEGKEFSIVLGYSLLQISGFGLGVHAG